MIVALAIAMGRATHELIISLAPHMSPQHATDEGIERTCAFRDSEGTGSPG